MSWRTQSSFPSTHRHPASVPRICGSGGGLRDSRSCARRLCCVADFVIGVPKFGRCVHTVGHSDDNFRRSSGASVQSGPKVGHSGRFERRFSRTEGHPGANFGRAGGSGGRSCPTFGKSARRDEEMDGPSGQILEAVGHSFGADGRTRRPHRPVCALDGRRCRRKRGWSTTKARNCPVTIQWSCEGPSISRQRLEYKTAGRAATNCESKSKIMIRVRVRK